jgi:hypothetical protein
LLLSCICQLLAAAEPLHRYSHSSAQTKKCRPTERANERRPFDRWRRAIDNPDIIEGFARNASHCFAH